MAHGNSTPNSTPIVPILVSGLPIAKVSDADRVVEALGQLTYAVNHLSGQLRAGAPPNGGLSGTAGRETIDRPVQRSASRWWRRVLPWLDRRMSARVRPDTDDPVQILKLLRME